jgi:hypothetical protein
VSTIDIDDPEVGDAVREVARKRRPSTDGVALMLRREWPEAFEGADGVAVAEDRVDRLPSKIRRQFPIALGRHQDAFTAGFWSNDIKQPRGEDRLN